MNLINPWEIRPLPLHPQRRFAWNALNHETRSRVSLGSPATTSHGWEAVGAQGNGRHRMDSYVWIRVVTSEWEYTERLA